MRYRKFLLIDDDTEDHEIFMTALGMISPDLDCTALTDATQALRSLDAQELAPDVIFLDLNMPIMTGQEFLVEYKKRQHLAAIPVIVISTSANPKTIANAKELGATDFITKPQRFQELVSILKPIIN